MKKYPIEHGTYRGYSIREVDGFITNKIIARCGNDVHSRRYHRPEQQEPALERLKADIDAFGTHE